MLLTALVLLAAILGFLAWRRRGNESRGDSSGTLTRLAALVAILIALPLITLGSAQSAKRVSAPAGFFGMITQTDFTSVDASKMAQGGVETLRLPVAWSSVQPDSTDGFDWGYTDSVVSQAAKAGISVLPFLYDSPSWVAKSTTTLPVSGAQPLYWAHFVSEAVARYGPNGVFWDGHGPESEDPVPKLPIRKWQIWNEANFFYFADPISPPKYASLLKTSNKTIKAIDPGATIVLSGLYGSPPAKQIKRRKAMASYDFLAKLYRAGARKYFDVAALHPYTPNTAQTKLLVEKFRKVMAAGGDRKKPLSITEVGWGSAPRGFLDVGSPAKQARQLKSAYTYFLGNRKKLKLESVFWFSWKDKKKSEPSCNFCYSTGLFDSRDGLRPKPAWPQFVKFAGGRP